MNHETSTRINSALQADESLRKAFYATKTPADAVALLAIRGCRVTVDDLAAWARGTGELSDDELGATSGGARASVRTAGGFVVTVDSSRQSVRVTSPSGESTEAEGSAHADSGSSGGSGGGGGIPWPPPPPPPPPRIF